MKSLLGFARFVDGGCSMTSTECRQDPFLQSYPCEKAYAWKADGVRAVPFQAPVPYPKGQLQIWHVTAEGFVSGSDKKAFLSMVPPAPTAGGGGEGSVKVKVEAQAEDGEVAEAAGGSGQGKPATKQSAGVASKRGEKQGRGGDAGAEAGVEEGPAGKRRRTQRERR